MATKRPCKTLDLEAMTNREVLSELVRMYGSLLDRLSAYADVLVADHVDRDDVDDNAPDDEFDSIYDQALGLISRIEEAQSDFRIGNGQLRSRNGDVWNWGLETYKSKFKQRAVAGLVTLRGGVSDAR